MTYIVTENCIRCKFTDCVEVCPADCFHEGKNFLVIDPQECIDCTLCAVECPVEAIYPDNALPAEYAEYLELNARLAKKWPLITTRREPSAEAEEWADRTDKRQHLVV